jgi:hypothetical protein
VPSLGLLCLDTAAVYQDVVGLAGRGVDEHGALRSDLPTTSPAAREPHDRHPKSRPDLLRPDGTVVRLGIGGFVGVLDPAGATPGRTPAG